MKRFLLGCLLAFPLLAQADPLNNGALAVLVYLALALVAFTALLVLLLVLAFLRPYSQRLQIAQGVCLLLFACLYLGVGRSFGLLGNEAHFALAAPLPLGLLLNGLTQARQAQHPPAGRAWTGVAVAGSTGMLWVLVGMLHLDRLWQPDLSSGMWRMLWHFSLALPVNVLSWLVVLTLLRRYLLPATNLWQPWWATPVSAAGIAAVYYVLNTLSIYFTKSNISPDLTSLLPSILLTAAACWLAGVVVLRLVRPLAQPQPGEIV